MFLKMAADQSPRGVGSRHISIREPPVTEQSTSQKTGLSSNLHADHAIVVTAETL